MTENEIIEEFNGVKFRKSTLSPAKNEFAETPDLLRVFISIANSNNLNVTQYHIHEILRKDLDIERTALNSQIFAVLVEALIYYIIKWPGWQRKDEYLIGTLKQQDWFDRFRQYLIYKTRYIITLASFTDKQTQTDQVLKKAIAPYSLCIGGPPHVLNNIVFEELNGDVLLRKCTVQEWMNPNLKQLLHWPHISVSLNLPDISISRTNIHHVERYIGLLTNCEIHSDANRIIHIKKISDSSCKMQPYSKEFFWHYRKHLMDILKCIPGVLTSRIFEINTILQEFFCDIVEANVYNTTICPNISIRYRMGNHTYIRNRRPKANNRARLSSSYNSISYFESIIPQMDICLHHFNVIQDITDQKGVTFVNLNNIQQKLKNKSHSSEIEKLCHVINKSCIIYSCRLCEFHTGGPRAQADIIEHIKVEHKAEQCVICRKCLKEFNVYTLAINRWSHECV